ncbi:NAD(P)/FAD-dependent oxidoreductase [Ancylobacter defluvii]|uniref:Oxidoreductase n=1 Tax=Ancylobacter defluvii TaxID=1282440 RepID=A0A9W6JW54_9HYPH|nr:FAD-binding oxidoreductase [Ancylobacter defluvii]MBS7587875.1 FAD-binding oxidoreductase [Ancylobacter defluvii]GLK83706.1 oxidoreductase [Ancylobacter defluvii]
MSPPVDAVASDEKLPSHADVVIVGAGIIGVSAAFYLARKGKSVVVVEKGRVGGEQSSRNWGWVRQQGRALPEMPLAMASQDLWSNLNADLGEDTGYRRTGMTVVTKDPAVVAQWEDMLEKKRAFQTRGRILSAAEMRKLLPGTTDNWLAGLHSPLDGLAEPSMATPAMARGARRLGAIIVQNCAVRGWETAGGAVSAVITERGAIKTDAVLCAGGAWTSMLLRHQGISLPQAGVFSSVCRTEAAPDISTETGGVGSPGFSVRRRADGGYTVAMRGTGRVDVTPQGIRYAADFLPLLFTMGRGLTIRAGRSFFAGPETMSRWRNDAITPFERMRVLDPAPETKILDKAMSQFRAAYPALKDVRVAQSWGGLIDSVPDAVPVISAIEGAPGVYVATGFSGHGFGLGPAGGRLAADLVAGDMPLVDPSPFRYQRFFDGTRHEATVWV